MPSKPKHPPIRGIRNSKKQARTGGSGPALGCDPIHFSESVDVAEAGDQGCWMMMRMKSFVAALTGPVVKVW